MSLDRTDYLLCAAVVPVTNITVARKMMRELKPKNRARLHMKDETRKAISSLVTVHNLIRS